MVCPKDWDTIAIIYNKDLLDAAGVDPAVMDSWTWNADDGGTFYQTIAKLSVDANGNNGLSPNFDMNNVTQYGFANNGMGGPYGQTEWSWLTATTGWTYNNGLWGNEYYYDDPRFISTVQWMATCGCSTASRRRWNSRPPSVVPHCSKRATWRWSPTARG